MLDEEFYKAGRQLLATVRIELPTIRVQLPPVEVVEAATSVETYEAEVVQPRQHQFRGQIQLEKRT